MYSMAVYGMAVALYVSANSVACHNTALCLHFSITASYFHNIYMYVHIFMLAFMHIYICIASLLPSILVSQIRISWLVD